MKKRFLFLILLVLLLSGCALVNQDEIFSVTLIDLGQSTVAEVEPGATVNQVLSTHQITLSPLDMVDPPLTTILAGGETIQITRVTEEFSIVESILPFEQQTIKNESLTEGQTVLIQSGVNGRTQLTYRILYEDGLEVSRTAVKEEVIQPAKPEILMIGVQSPFSAIPVDGVIAYISSSNAWIMEINTGNRKVVVSTGDLDGRIFTLSFDRKWLLFSRSAEDPTGEKINGLWIVDITQDDPQPIDTSIRDVVHYADWIPGKNRTFSFSTVEPRTTAPGWQANNDLHIFKFDDEGKKLDDTLLVDSNSGGLYGWWGTIFQWSPDGSHLAYARPDSIGLVDTKNGELKVIMEFSPYQPKTDWAWVPSINWSADNSVIFTIFNTPGSDGQLSDSYDLTAILLEENRVLPLVTKCGLFCYPVLSLIDEQGNYQVGYLSSILPDQSETSRYNLNVMDRDGSNRKRLYPGEGLQGLDPQTISWSPTQDETGNTWMAFIAQGNIMLAEIPSGSIKQVTGDGSITKLTWR